MARCSQNVRGFSLVELVAVVGIVMIVLGLFLPAFSKSRERARTVADASQLRQCSLMASLYSGDHQELYPVARPTAFHAGRFWYEPLVSLEYFGSTYEVDPSGMRRFGNVTYDMSVCMAYSPEYMLPGRTRPVDEAMSVGVRVSAVTYPSLKGAFFKRSSGEGTIDEGATWFCCHQRWTVPVVMADASVTVGDFLHFSGGAMPVIVDGVGVPVASTWGGFMARDR